MRIETQESTLTQIISKKKNYLLETVIKLSIAPCT